MQPTYAMSTKIVTALLVVSLFIFSGLSPLMAENPEKDLDLESINFAFDSAKAVEDLKQLRRVMALMNLDPDLRIEINAHTDTNGPDTYNKKLSRKRADAVKKAFINKGLSPNRIHIKANSFHVPFATNKTLEGQLLNRRVDFSIFKMKEGQRDYYYKDNRFIKPLENTIASSPTEMQTAPASQEGNGIDDVMERLDNLERLLKEKETAPPVVSAGPSELDSSRNGGSTNFDIFKSNVFSLSGGIGSSDGDLMGNIEGALFLPVKDNHFALQGGFTGDITEDLQQYQVDAGLVGKNGWFQLGAFASVKWVNMDLYDDVATLSQIHVGASRLFERGKVGIFFTRGIQDEDVVETQQYYEYADLYTTETYLEVSDKIGINAEYLFDNGLFLYGDIGSHNADDADFFGSLRVSYPVNKAGDLRVFCQGDYNNGYLEDDDNYSAFIGIELTTPYSIAKTGNTDQGAPNIRPMGVQPIAYEVKRRTSVLLSDINHAPTVSITTNRIQGTSPLEVRFTAVASDPDGTIVSHEWDFGDGDTGTGEQVTHSFSGSGLYNVTLTVTDNKGRISTASTTVDVTNIPPQVGITTSELQGEAPHTVTFTASALDSDGEIVSYEWRFGDGETATGETVTHTFKNPGSYHVTVTVTDNLFAATTASVTVTASNYPPTVNLYYALSQANPSTVLFSAGGWDSDGSLSSFTWNLGDGTILVGSQVEHTYDAPGVYTVTVTATDTQGMTSKETVTVNIP